MNPLRFPLIDRALHFTTEYFSVGRVASCISKLDGGLNLSYLDTYYDVTLHSHGEMEAEITQNMMGANHNIHQDMFEKLKDALGWWCFNDGYKEEIEWKVDEYNVKAWNTYENEVKIEEEKFKEKVNYKIGHLVEFTKEYPSGYGLLGYYPKRTATIKNEWFYCNTKKSEAINKDLLPDYYQMLDTIVNSFKKSCVKYVNRFFNGNIASSAEVIIEKHYLQTVNEPKLIEDAKPIEEDKNTSLPPKIKVNVPAGQLIALFRLLYDIEPAIFDIQDQSELREFIRNNFITKKTKGTSMNYKKTANHFSTPDAKDIKHWIQILKKMGDNAAKF